jgi:hypothetical protein
MTTRRLFRLSLVLGTMLGVAATAGVASAAQGEGSYHRRSGRQHRIEIPLPPLPPLPHLRFDSGWRDDGYDFRGRHEHYRQERFDRGSRWQDRSDRNGRRDDRGRRNRHDHNHQNRVHPANDRAES